MNEFRKYDSVARYGKEDVEGILNGTCYIFEKIDGANISLYYHPENGLTICSRNRILADDTKVVDNFRGLVDYIKSNKNIKEMVKNNPNYIFYGEYLCPHTIKYPIDKINQVYFFDIFNKDSKQYFPYEALQILGNMYKVNFLRPLFILENPTIEQCKEHLNINTFNGNPKQEGIVIKNYKFLNKFGRPCYAKIVNEEFKELNREIFGKRSKCCHWQVEEELDEHIDVDSRTITTYKVNKCSKCGKECEIEIYEPPKKEKIETKIANKYCTQARVEKIIYKIEYNQDIITEQIYPYKTYRPKISEEDIPQLLGMVYNDIIIEEMWDIVKSFKNPTVNFKILQSEIYKLTKVWFFKYLEEAK